MATKYSYDNIEKIYAWRDNNTNFILTQGEGYVEEIDDNDAVKSPKFQLLDERGEIVPPLGSWVDLAVKRPNGTEALIHCVIEQNNSTNTSYISVPIHKSLSAFAGRVKGEIRLITPNAVIKFYGINFYVNIGVSDEAAEQSESFPDLVEALNKIVACDQYGKIDLDELSNGELPENGVNPVASGVLCQFLKKFVRLSDTNKLYVYDYAPPYYIGNPDYFKTGDVWVVNNGDNTTISILKAVSSIDGYSLYKCTWEPLVPKTVSLESLPSGGDYLPNSHHYTDSTATEYSYPTYLTGDQVIVNGSTYKCQVLTPYRTNSQRTKYVYRFTRIPTNLDTYTCEEVDNLLENIHSLSYEVVEEKPPIDEAQLDIIYLVPDSESEDAVYEQWLCVEESGNRTWKQLGSTSIDLSNYATKDDLKEKAPVIITDTALAYDTDISSLTSSPAVLDHGLTFNVQEDNIDYPHLMLSQGANLLPAIESLSTSSDSSGVTAELFNGKTILLNGTCTDTLGVQIYAEVNGSRAINILSALAQNDSATFGALCSGTSAAGNYLRIRFDLEGQNTHTSIDIDGETKVSDVVQSTAACTQIKITIQISQNTVLNDFAVTPFAFAGNEVDSISNPSFVNGWCNISNSVQEYSYISTYPNKHKVGYGIDTKTYIDSQYVGASNKMDYAPQLTNGATSTALHAGQAFSTDTTIGIKTNEAGVSGDKQSYTTEYVDANYKKTIIHSNMAPPCLCSNDGLFSIGDEWVVGAGGTSCKYTLHKINYIVAIQAYHYIWNINTPVFKTINDDVPTNTKLQTYNYGGAIGSAYPQPTYSYGAVAITPTEMMVCDGYTISSDQSGTYANFTWNSVGLNLKESLSNKVTALSSSSTDTQYPSAKCVYDLVIANSSIRFEIVEEKPTEDIQTNVIYLVPSDDPETDNVYEEWVYIADGNEGSWELIGTTNVDLSQYATKAELAEKAPIIHVETPLAYDNNLSNLRTQSTDGNVFVNISSLVGEYLVSDRPNLVLSEGANLLPNMSSSPNGSVNGGTIEVLNNNTIRLNGTFAYQTNIYLQSSGENKKIAILDSLSSGDSIAIGALYDGVSSDHNISVTYRLSDGSNTTLTKTISGEDVTVDTMQAQGDCNIMTIRIVIPEGASYTNYLITPFVFAGSNVSIIENPSFVSSWLDVSDDVETYNYLSTYPYKHKVACQADTKEYIDSTVGDAGSLAVTKMDYAPVIDDLSGIDALANGQVFATDETVGVKTADQGQNGDKQSYTTDYIDEHFAPIPTGRIDSFINNTEVIINKDSGLYVKGQQVFGAGTNDIYECVSIVTDSTNTTYTFVKLETASRKVVSLSSASTDEQYPSAKCVYNAINSGSNNAPVYSKNLLDLATVQTGKSLNTTTGEVEVAANKNVSDYMPVEVGKYLVASYYVNRLLSEYTLHSVCFYDSNKEFLSSSSNVASVIVPSSAVYARVCGSDTMLQSQSKVQIEIAEDRHATYYEPHRADSLGLTDDVISANRIFTRDNANDNFYIALPHTIFSVDENTLRIYYKNILSHPKYAIVFYSAVKLNNSDTVDVTVSNYDDYAEFYTTGSGKVKIPYAVYDDNFNMVYYDNVEIHVTDSEPSSMTALIIGDGTVAYNDSLSTQLIGLFSDTESTLTLLGTKGTGTYKHEGRSGWSANDYVSVASKSSVTNAFWDGEKFNFSYYMTQQNYEGADVVFLQLGLDDLINKDIAEANNSAVLDAIDEIINSIKAYSNSVRVVVNLILPPNSDGVTFANQYHGNQVDWLYKYTTIRCNNRLDAMYRDDDSVDVLGVNTELNSNTDFYNGTIPASDGFQKMASIIYNYMSNEIETEVS